MNTRRNRKRSQTRQKKKSENWLNQTSTSNRYTTQLDEESEDQQQKAGPENTLFYLQSVLVHPANCVKRSIQCHVEECSPALLCS
jgi:hypothetical protein